MKQEPKRILFVNSEMMPFLPETKISKIGRFLSQGIQEKGKEIRSFMPRYGCINERRNQLHEVIRLSGMNIVIDDIDRPLIIKVSSIPAARMQVYFIDNEDYFQRKFIYQDADGKFYEDNDERAIFFARGVIETVKKLRWKPDVVHCQGWMASNVPIMLKKVYHEDPLFENVKVVTSVYNEFQEERFSDKIASKLDIANLTEEEKAIFGEFKSADMTNMALHFSDGAIIADENFDKKIADALAESGKPVLDYVDAENDETYIDRYNEFYDKLLG